MLDRRSLSCTVLCDHTRSSIFTSYLYRNKSAVNFSMTRYRSVNEPGPRSDLPGRWVQERRSKIVRHWDRVQSKCGRRSTRPQKLFSPGFRTHGVTIRNHATNGYVTLDRTRSPPDGPISLGRRRPGSDSEAGSSTKSCPNAPKSNRVRSVYRSACHLRDAQAAENEPNTDDSKQTKDHASPQSFAHAIPHALAGRHAD